MKETRKRSLVKALTYRVIVTLVAFLLAYHYTESVEKSIQIIVYYYLGSVIIYFLHERLWLRIRWGREE
ncbi:DUF2061 domain-containing protein [Candidatus Aerophobetes bacterium]|nr:DUF2061 domain-containing protein [Candidatus Aerophobetes bacterium]